MESISLFVFVFTLLIARVNHVFARRFAEQNAAAVIDHPTSNHLKRDVDSAIVYQSIHSNVGHEIDSFHMIYDLTDESDGRLVCRA